MPSKNLYATQITNGGCPLHSPLDSTIESIVPFPEYFWFWITHTKTSHRSDQRRGEGFWLCPVISRVSSKRDFSQNFSLHTYSSSFLLASCVSWHHAMGIDDETKGETLRVCVWCVLIEALCTTYFIKWHTPFLVQPQWPSVAMSLRAPVSLLKTKILGKVVCIISFRFTYKSIGWIST